MAASVIGALRVNLGLDSAQFSKGLSQSSGRLSRFAAQAGKIAAGLAASFGTAMTAMGVGAINAASEIERLSQVANTAPKQFQGWAAGAASVGIEQEKLADILKDVNDRVGDFVATGGGPMADFFTNIAPKVGVTAEQFRNLSGADALQLYVSSLEKANANQQDFTFYMEAMASDSTLLLPLLKNGGKAMQDYAEKASRMGAIMDNQMIASLREGKGAVAEMRLAVDGMKNTIGAQALPVIKALAAAVSSAATFFHQHAETISSVLRTLAGVAIAVAVAFGVQYAVAVGVTAVRAMASAIGQSIALEVALGAQTRAAAIAGLAAKGLAAAFGVLRTALITTGIGAVVVLVGYLIGKFIELVGKVGGVGAAFKVLAEMAKISWQAIIDSAAAIPPGLEAAWASVKAGFYSMLAGMQRAWSRFLGMMVGAMDSIGATDLAFGFSDAMSAANTSLGETEDTIESLSGVAAAKGAEAAAALKSAWAPVVSKWRELKATTDAAADSLGGHGGTGGGLAAAADKAGDSGSKAAAKLTPLQEVIKRLREEARRLQATLGMTDLQAKIWGDQNEAGVSATSEAGRAIAALNTQIDTLNRVKDATQRGRDAFNDLFSSVLEGASAARQALGNLLMEIAKAQFSKAALGVLGSTTWGSGLIGTVGGLIGANANGTSNWRGGLTRINERGGEIVDLPSGTRIIPHDVSMRMADGAAQVERTSVEIIPSPYFDTRVAQISTAGDMRTAQMARQAMPGQLGDMQARGTR